jgi:hypothetical protein
VAEDPQQKYSTLLHQDNLTWKKVAASTAKRKHVLLPAKEPWPA